MSTLKGFAPLGMLFILMDVLRGEEGLVRINRLARALSVGKPAMLVQLENLERAGLIRTVSSSQRGRYIELLVPNFMKESAKTRQETPAAREGTEARALLSLNALPEQSPRNFSLDKLKELQNYLSARGIRVVSMPDESRLDPQVAQIAAYLGKYLSHVQSFYTRLKATLNEGEEFQFPLFGQSQRAVSHILNFAKTLKDAGFLASFSYLRAPRRKIVAKLDRTPSSINFLSGGWLEHYIRDKVTAILTTHPTTMDTPYAFMKNPRIVLPGDEDFEFDFLLMIEKSVFWIEAKTGEYMDYIGKYARVAKLLDLSRNTNLLVLADAPKPDENISARWGISCCGVDEFPEVFRLALLRELGRYRKGV
ncbi:MAG: MarR family transcriptional regulator [Synergistaceae bacterium]|nr:MarR family transcriptional regulator [Synergistaceae bacterium]